MVKATADEDLLKMLAHTKMKTRAATSDHATMVTSSDFSTGDITWVFHKEKHWPFPWHPAVSPTLTCEAASANENWLISFDLNLLHLALICSIPTRTWLWLHPSLTQVKGLVRNRCSFVMKLPLHKLCPGGMSL